MLQPSSGQAAFGQKDENQPLALQLLLFVDERPSSQENVRRIQEYLQQLQADYPFELQVVEIEKQPQLLEHFRLVATPALVKVAPGARHILAGSDLIAQLQKWWSRWQMSCQQQPEEQLSADNLAYLNNNSGFNSASYSSELMQLSDEIFLLKQEKEELLGQLKFKDQVLAMLAHDLRSPLTAASIALETLELADEEDTERNQRIKKQLYKQSHKQFQIMNRMITDLLQASKSMSRQLQVQHKLLYLQSFCAEILGQFTEQLQQKSQKLKQDIPQDLPAVYADEELIRQVVVNLLDNAIKYTPEGGTITFSIIHRTMQKIQVSVCDTGPGIPEEKQERIFEGHFRLKRDEAKEGYGLGLALCRKIIRAHYGHIWVDSVPQKGSCFHFSLPVYRQ